MKDWRILSHGRKIFTADDRFDLVQDDNPDPSKITRPKPPQTNKQKSYFSFANPNNNNNNMRLVVLPNFNILGVLKTAYNLILLSIIIILMKYQLVIILQKIARSQ